VAAVPEVVPDEHALPNEQSPVEMRRSVAGLGRERHEHRSDDTGQPAGEQRFPAR
jgi:hypothetical protein